jgi:peptidylprolyl isomerase
MRTRRLTALALSALALGVAGCGDDLPDPNAGSAIDGDLATTLPKTLQSASAPAPKERKPGEPLPPANVSGVSTDLKSKPKVPKGTGEAPTELQGDDVVTGSGKEAKAGDTVSVQYVGVLWKDGKEFDSSWSRKSEPFEFTIGQSQVIQGWDQGVPGMKVGGRRTLVIPAAQAYGAAGSPPNIGPNEPLTFVIDLKKVS